MRTEVIPLVRWVVGHAGIGLRIDDAAILDAIAARGTGAGRQALRTAERVAGCALCFPAGTRVATSGGEVAIQSLHVGDAVLAEDPKTGRVEADPVQAVIADPVSPLLAVALSDGSAITVTADHPFWVDAGQGVAGSV